MWSDRYYYLNIVGDLSLRMEYSTQTLVSFLKARSELTQVSNFQFKNSKQLPHFVSLLILKANSYSNWSDRDVNPYFSNMIAVVCSKGDDRSFAEMGQLLIKIACFLNWQVIDEETDDGEENVVLWQPGPPV